MTIEEIEADIKAKTQLAISYAQDDIKEICRKHVFKFYADLAPKLYRRTYQLPETIMKSGVKSSGLGASGKVYFDSSPLNYAPVIRLKDGSVRFNEWGEEKIFNLAMMGSHGGHPGRAGYSIWKNASSELDSKAEGILMAACKKAGL